MNLDLDNLKNTAAKTADIVETAAAKVKDALGNLPGAAIDKADGDKVNEHLEKERTKVLGNNPRING